MLSREDIKNRLGALWEQLPDDYKYFLEETNRGMPSDTNRYLEVVNLVPGGNTSINYFFSIVNKEYPELEIEYIKREYQRFLQKNMLSVAVDDFGNLILLSLEEKHELFSGTMKMRKNQSVCIKFLIVLLHYLMRLNQSHYNKQ